MIKSPKVLGLCPYFSRAFVWNEVTRAPSLLFPQPSKELLLAFPGSSLIQRGLTACSSPTHPSLTHPPAKWFLLCIHQPSHLWPHLPSVCDCVFPHPSCQAHHYLIPRRSRVQHTLYQMPISARHLVLFLPPLSLQGPWLPISFVPSDSVYFPSHKCP